MYYFNTDGSYGKRTEETTDFNIAVPTSNWTQDMLELIAGWADEHRYDLARHFNVNVHYMSNGVCTVCTLDAERLDGQYLVHKKGQQWAVVEQDSSVGARQICW
jgi:hypothetical protein